MNHAVSTPVLPTAYDLPNTHIQCTIHTPAAQQACQACVSRLFGEDEDDWAHLLRSFDRSNQWLPDPQRDGNIVLCWSSAT